MKSKKIIVDLGCGKRKIKGAIGVDSNPDSDADIIQDLNWKIRLPDDYADVTYSSYLMEEIREPLRLINEMVRITKPNGIIHMKVPHYTSDSLAWKHKHKGFSIKQFEKIKGTFPISIRLNYMYTNYKRNPLKELINKIISGIANINPKFCERFWIYWLGGFSELEIKLLKLNQKVNA